MSDGGNEHSGNAVGVVCPSCGYDLSGHVAPTICPECGFDMSYVCDPIRQSQWSTGRMVRHWLWPLVLIALGVGFLSFPPLVGAHSLWWMGQLGFVSIGLGLVLLAWTTLRALSVLFGKRPRRGDGVARAVLQERGKLQPLRQAVAGWSIVVFGGIAVIVILCVRWIINFDGR